jgi:ribosome assembly protein 4
MATVLPPASKRQRTDHLERTKTQQDLQPILAPDLGSFKARFVDGDGRTLTSVVEIPVADATEKNVSLLLNTLLGKVDIFDPGFHRPN